MDLEPWDPWREFERVRDQVDGLLKSFFAKVRQVEKSRPITFFPDTDVVETADDVRIYLSLPGMVEEDIEIAVHGGVLVVRGEREAPYDPERAQRYLSEHHLREWTYGYFERRLSLPAGTSPQDLSASFRSGVLSIVVPKRKTSS